MKALAPIVNLWRLAYYTAALRNLQRTNPMHPDLPEIVLVIHSIRSQQ